MKKSSSDIAHKILIKLGEPSWLKELPPELREKMRQLRGARYEPGSEGILKLNPNKAPIAPGIYLSLTPEEKTLLRRLRIINPRSSVADNFRKKPSSGPGDPYRITAAEQLRRYRVMSFKSAPIPRGHGAKGPDFPKDPSPKTNATANVAGAPKIKGRARLLLLGALGIGALGAGGYGLYRSLADDELERSEL